MPRWPQQDPLEGRDREEKEGAEAVERMEETGGRGLVRVRMLAGVAVWVAVVMAWEVVRVAGEEREVGVKELRKYGSGISGFW